MIATNTTATAMISVIIAVVLFFGATVLDALLIRRWEKWWRVAACFPLAALVALVLLIVVGIMRDPTAHNLWPLELALWGAGALIALGLISLLRKILNAK